MAYCRKNKETPFRFAPWRLFILVAAPIVPQSQR